MPDRPSLRPQQVSPHPLTEIAALVGAGTTVGATQVTGVTHDSRQVRSGDLYVALPGANTHGARFADRAGAAGAAAIWTDPAGADEIAGADQPVQLPVIVSPAPRSQLGTVSARIYGDPARDLLMLGITGTNGKTTTSYLIEAGLQAAGHQTGMIGTVETRVAGRTIPSVRTTPEATDVHSLLAVMRERGVTACVMEVSSHALVFGRVDGIVFDVAGFTNLSQDHLDFHTDLEDYFAAKADLFTPVRARRGVVCVDDTYGQRLAAEAGVPLITVATGTGATAGPPGPVGGAVIADWQVTNREVARSGASTRADLEHRTGRTVSVGSPIPGDFNVANAALAVVMLMEAGVEARDALRGVATCSGVPGRMERVQSTGVGEPLAVVDYAHTPDAIANVLRALRPSTTGRLIIVIGAGGDRDRDKRPLMGAVAAQEADLVIVTDDNPRSEDPADIRAAVLRGAAELRDATGAEGTIAEVREVPDRGKAIEAAVAAATGPADTVVVAGKGHEQGQEIAGVVHPFDDRLVLRQTIQRWNNDRQGDEPSSAGARRPEVGRVVMPTTLAEVAAATGGTLDTVDDAARPVTGPVVADSRHVEPGGLFVAIPGERVDGHDFAAGAVMAGAVAVLAERPVGVPAVIVGNSVEALGKLAVHHLRRLDATVVGVTGSSGKTSTKDLLAQVLAARGPIVAPAGSYNTEVGVPLTVLAAGETTRTLVIEMGARGVGHIEYLCKLAPPQVGIVLNVGSAHIGEFGSRDEIARAKRELVEALPETGTAVLNADDPAVRQMADATDARVLMFGESVHADIRAEDITLDAGGRASFTIVTPDGAAPVKLGLVGEHQVSNALATAAAAHALDLDLATVATALTAARPLSSWRMEVTDRADGVTVINDAYNANPESMRAALKSLAAIGRGRRTWAVLGEMLELGDASNADHDALGRLVVRLGINRLIAVGEGARPIQLGAAHEGSWGDEAAWVPDGDAALAQLRTELAPGDVVLVKASRATGLERVAEALTSEEEAVE